MGSSRQGATKSTCTAVVKKTVNRKKGRAVKKHLHEKKRITGAEKKINKKGKGGGNIGSSKGESGLKLGGQQRASRGKKTEKSCSQQKKCGSRMRRTTEEAICSQQEEEPKKRTSSDARMGGCP